MRTSRGSTLMTAWCQDLTFLHRCFFEGAIKPSGDSSVPVEGTAHARHALNPASPSLGRDAHGPRIVAGDESRAPGIGEPSPDPIEEHGRTVAEADETIDMDDAPQHPGKPARELEPGQICHCRRAANRRKRALLAIAERRRWCCPGCTAADQLSDVAPSLLRHCRYAGQWFAARIDDESCVPNDEDLRMSRHRKVGRHG